ncbi:uncharacterized protein GGS25DRAFT_21250 [Hypoxylon fragiforme]|uniref:uncharacterized protein n=1 Tax=Hypoxylon fragiforme TaxID=63214 RepID=UPI0020C6B5A8|nr:uncharacterized protein GGS25DRAFT_21250 [Hypoxylon fragiforme]KAI2613858.1 hypothetical protein GGS25DRAFT_21250 [Hypoxylon fragiforme]
MSWACDDCNRIFGTWRSRQQHLDALGHDPLDYECRWCDDIFCDEEERRDHEAFDHHYCGDCDRLFQSYNCVKMHLNSRIHRGSDGILCPFCKTGYATATGLAHHLEGGHCSRAPFLNRDEVYKVVRAKDPSGLISKKLLGWHGSERYEVTGNTWNGYAYECYLCHRDFKTLQGLSQHLNSPAHQQPLYHCPNRRNCGRDFKTLAAVMNHLESESCSFIRFEDVQKTVTDLVSSDRRLTFG